MINSRECHSEIIYQHFECRILTQMYPFTVQCLHCIQYIRNLLFKEIPHPRQKIHLGSENNLMPFRIRVYTYGGGTPFCVAMAGHQHQGRYRRHRHFGISVRYRSIPVLDWVTFSVTGLIPVPEFLFIPVLDWPDAGQSGILKNFTKMDTGQGYTLHVHTTGGGNGIHPAGTRPQGTHPPGARPQGTHPSGTRPQGTHSPGTRLHKKLTI